MQPIGGSMDQIKVGNFIASMRKERGLTQEGLGERLGVTNKTISRWETGKYMPDIDKLQELSSCLGVSVNELLSGEKIENAADFVKKADENLVDVLNLHSAFSLQEKIVFYKRKWLKEHNYTLEYLNDYLEHSYVMQEDAPDIFSDEFDLG